MKIKAYTGYGKTYRTHETFELVDKLPKVGEDWNNETVTSVSEIELDSEQANDSAYNYRYFSIEKEDAEGETSQISVALELKNCYKYSVEAGDLRSYSDSIEELEEEFADQDEYQITENRTGTVVKVK